MSIEFWQFREYPQCEMLHIHTYTPMCANMRIVEAKGPPLLAARATISEKRCKLPLPAAKLPSHAQSAKDAQEGG